MKRTTFIIINGILVLICSMVFSLIFSFIFLLALNKNGRETGSTTSIVSSQDEAVQQAAKTASASVVSIVVEDTSSLEGLKGAGTGVIITESGLIVTNKHVVPEGVNSITVVLEDGSKITTARVVARDPSNDLAFVKIDSARDLPAAKFGDSSRLKAGQTVIAIGNALGQFQNTVTSGVVSGMGRPIEASDAQGGGVEQLYNLIQTDTAINPGNSGGPLINISGEVVGINVAASTDAENIGFAIPINDIKPLINQLVNTGKISRAFLGVNYIPMSEEVAGYINSNIKEGAYVYADGATPAVASGSPADKAGIKSGDIIVMVNDKKVDQANPLGSIINNYKAGETVQITIIRENKELKLSVTLAEKSS